MVTLFTCPKPFHGHIGVIQRNALRSWAALGAGAQVLVIGEEDGAAEAAAACGAGHLPRVERNAQGTPLVSAIFEAARAHAEHDTLCYVNADILLLEDFLPAVAAVRARFERFLIAGQRWDLDVEEEGAFDPDGLHALQRRLQGEGRRHPPSGSDYFVFRREQFLGMPPFALGRSGWDNWMIYAARAARVPVVDASGAITVVHQNHDYAHLPDGQAHYRLPESLENVRLGGGREMIFTLGDATWDLRVGRLRRRWMARNGPARTVEAALLAQLGPGRAARAVRLLLHPAKTVRYFAGRRGGAPIDPEGVEDDAHHQDSPEPSYQARRRQGEDS